MISKTANKLLEYFNGTNNSDNMLVEYSQIASTILDLICNDTKMLSDSGAKVFSKEESTLIVKDFLLGKNADCISKMANTKSQSTKLDYVFNADGKLHIFARELSCFYVMFKDFKNGTLSKSSKKILNSYASKISKNPNLDEKYCDKLEKNIEKQLSPNDSDPSITKLYSKYIVNNILKNKEFISKIIQKSNSKPTKFGFFPMPGKRKAIVQEILQDILSNKSNLNVISYDFMNVKQLYYETKAQLLALSTDLTNMEPSDLENRIIELNDTLLSQTGKQSYYYTPGQYRDTAVKVSGKIMTINGEYGYNEEKGRDSSCKERLDKAMAFFAQDVINTAQNSKNMSEEEYLKKVAMLHYRYISIHPFSDGNGRTGRMITNMLLKQKGMVLNIDYESQKSRYIEIMNTISNGLENKNMLSQYIENLYTNPEQNRATEEEFSGELMQFIRENAKEQIPDTYTPEHQFTRQEHQLDQDNDELIK